MRERKYWKQYMKAYEACMSATSTKDSPWYVVPADDKKDAQLIVSQILLDTLGKLQLRYPELDAERRKQLKNVRKMLEE